MTSTQNIDFAPDLDPGLGPHRFSHPAMATIYELLIVHEDAQYAQQAAHEAFCELDRLEGDLSRFIENSDISKINSLEENQEVRVGLAAFECLQRSAEINKETGGAFDVTVGPLLQCWLNEDKSMRAPSAEELDLARQHTGMHLLQLNEQQHTVKVLASSIHVDLGGIGKGYAVDHLAGLLCDWDLDTALIHGGTSSVFALGAPPGTDGWLVTLSDPVDHNRILARLHLQDQALSGSGLHKGQHIIDPRTGRAAKGNLAAWACGRHAITTDAQSTAFMIMSPGQIEKYCMHNQDALAMIVTGDAVGKERIVHFGPWNAEDLLYLDFLE